MKRKREGRNMTVPGKTSRKQEQIHDVPFNACLINCRSLKPKINSLVQCFKMNNLTTALLNETWLYRSDPQVKKMLTSVTEEHGIRFIRKDRDSRGGGVAVAYDSSKINLKKLNLNCLKKKNHLEIVVATGKLKNYKKDVTVISCYIPPGLSKNESAEFLDALSDVITEVKKKVEGWIVLGGDWNGRPLDLALDMYPEIKKYTRHLQGRTTLWI